jgi:hypothetical protein
MPARRRCLLLPILLFACDNPEPAAFAEEFPAAICDWTETCATGGDGLAFSYQIVALNGPIQGLASTLAAIPRGLVVALDQIEKQKAAA